MAHVMNAEDAAPPPTSGSPEPAPGLPEPPPGYVWAQPAPEPPSWKAPLWLKVLSVLWIAGLLIGGVYYSKHGDATVREQTTIASGKPVADAAIAAVIVAAGPGPVIAMSSYAEVTTCRVTPVRPGADYVRSVTLYTAPGGESALVRTIAAGLPARYQATASKTSPATLYGDAGKFVGVLGAVKGSGQVYVKAETGCRPVGAPLASAAPVTTPAPKLAGVLSALGVQAGSLTRTQVACPNGGVIETDRATVPASHAPGPLKNTGLSSTPVVATDDLYAYRTSGADVVIRRNDAGLEISVTTRC